MNDVQGNAIKAVADVVRNIRRMEKRNVVSRAACLRVIDACERDIERLRDQLDQKRRSEVS